MDSFQQNNPPNNSNNNGNNPKKGNGRKKNQKQKIENEINRQVTFSKRRGGIFKKANELSTLCGADVSVIVFSPSNKAHSFGSPNVDTIARRFWNQTSLGITGPNQIPTSQKNPITRQRNQDLAALESRLEEVTKHKKEEEKMKRVYQPNLGDLSIEQLNEEMQFMLNFKDDYETKLNKDESSKGSEGSSSLPTMGPCGDQLWDYQSVQVQQPEYNMDYHFENNGYMYGNMHPSNYPTAQFEMGSSSNANSVFPIHGQTFFIDPLDPTGNNFGYPYPNPNEASGSNLMLPYIYGFPTDFVPDDDDDGTATDEEEGEEE